jgi:hypothetical protein
MLQALLYEYYVTHTTWIIIHTLHYINSVSYITLNYAYYITHFTSHTLHNTLLVLHTDMTSLRALPTLDNYIAGSIYCDMLRPW